MTGQEWKDVRAAISPTFTSGKIKRYSAQMKECAERLCSRLHSIAENEGKINLKGYLIHPWYCLSKNMLQLKGVLFQTAERNDDGYHSQMRVWFEN